MIDSRMISGRVPRTVDDLHRSSSPSSGEVLLPDHQVRFSNKSRTWADDMTSASTAVLALHECGFGTRVAQFGQDGRNDIVVAAGDARKPSSSDTRVSCIFSPGRMPVHDGLRSSAAVDRAPWRRRRCSAAGNARDVGLAAARLATARR